jgi:nitrite reductase (NO-forming)
MHRSRHVTLLFVLVLLLCPQVTPTEAAKGNSDAAHACRQGGYGELVRYEDGTGFANTGECVSYAARGGTLDRDDDTAATPVPEGEEQASPAAEAAGGTSEGITIEAVDVAWNPDTATIPADTDVTITVPNTGAVVHTFVIEEADVRIEIEPGGTVEVVVNLPAGTYTFICDVPGHEEAGMIGTLTVE